MRNESSANPSSAGCPWYPSLARQDFWRAGVSRRAVVPFVLGCAGLLAALLVDLFHFKLEVLHEGAPQFSRDYLLRNVLILVSVIAIFRSIIIDYQLVWPRGRGAGAFPLRGFEWGGAAASLLLSLFFAGLLVFSPAHFNALSLEDGLVEWASAIMLFASGVLFLLALSRLSKGSGQFTLSAWTLVVFAVGVIFIGLEEVSWFQRVFGVETPEAFADNRQEEMNLHNFATDKFENLYYFGAFLFFVGLPFLRFLRLLPSDNAYLRRFAPYPALLFVGAVGCAYNYDMWNIVFSQAAFFASLLLMLSVARYTDDRGVRGLCVVTSIVVLATQVCFLSCGAAFERGWEITEYREFFIPLAILMYAVGINAHGASGRATRSLQA